MGSIDAGVGHAMDPDSSEAGRAATRAAIDALTETPTIVYVFASSEYESDALLSGVNEVTDATVTGCTTAGEIAGTGSHTESVVVMAIGGDRIEASVGSAAFDYDAGVDHAGRESVADALDGLDRDAIEPYRTVQTGEDWETYPEVCGTFFCDYNADGASVLEGMTDAIEPMTVHGGVAADDWKFDLSASVFHDTDAIEYGASFAALDLDVKTGMAAKHGYETTGDRYVITAAEGEEIHELDGRPALEVYRDEFGPQVQSPQFRITRPMGIDVGEPERRIIAIAGIDDETDALSITNSRAVTVGREVTFMAPTGEAVIEGAGAAIDEAMARAGDPDDVAAVLLHDCLSRWFFLSDSETRGEELEAIQNRVGPDVPIAGWYTAGEIATPGALNGLYDQTIVVWVLTNESR